MNRNLFIANRLREVFLNGKWVANTNIKEQITSISWEQAIQKVENLNTIALLIYHLNYYLDGLLRAFESGQLDISDKFSFDMPEITSEESWNKLVADFLKNAEQFANKVEQIDNDAFDQAFIDPKYGTLERNIEGVIEHSYYHFGQISLIRKMINQVN